MSLVLRGLVVRIPHHYIGPCVHFQVRGVKKSIKDRIDYSKYPTLNEEDLESSFIHGSGPGGQKVNKAHNAVSLIHKPTKIRVKCHLTREAHKNYKLAKELLLEKLDHHFNGQDSVANQIKRIEEERRNKFQDKAARKRQLKAIFRSTQDQDQDQESSGQESSEQKSSGQPSQP